MAHWMNLGHMLKVNAKKFPAKSAIRDKERSFTYPETPRIEGSVLRMTGSAYFLSNTPSGQPDNVGKLAVTMIF